MIEAVISVPVRTPVGRFGGVFRDIPAHSLATEVVRAAVSRAGVDGALIDDVILGQGSPNGEAPAIGRVAALDAGLGIDVPGMQVDRRCGSGLQAVMQACMQVATGVSDVVLAGGAESMSQAEFYTADVRWGIKAPAATLHDRLARARVTVGGEFYPVPGGMIETAENLRAKYGISRVDQDALALQSHQRAVAAHEAGRFAEELAPVTVPQRKGDPVVVDRDEHPRPETTMESLSSLRPLRQESDSEATVTAGNASGQNDGAAVCLVTSAEMAAELGLSPLLRLVTWSVAGVHPAEMGFGPVPASAKALARAGLSLDDIGVIELNEAFAAQALAVIRAWGRDGDDEDINPNGSGISLGHPVGATGGRILATLAYEMQRREARYGLETMCIGGGMGIAAIFERVVWRG